MGLPWPRLIEHTNSRDPPSSLDGRQRRSDASRQGAGLYTPAGQVFPPRKKKKKKKYIYIYITRSECHSTSYCCLDRYRKDSPSRTEDTQAFARSWQMQVPNCSNGTH